MTEKTTRYQPTSVSPPGDTIEDMLLERGLERTQLGEALGLSCDEVDALLGGTSSIEPRLAAGLEVFFGAPSARFWLNRERAYRTSLTSVSTEKAVG